MVQFSFWLDIVTAWGLRTGEITESFSYRGSNEGVHYGDVTLSLALWQGVMRYQIKIALRNRKFCRNDEGKVKNITLTEQIELMKLYRCLVWKFLALALADNVFDEQKAPEDFEDRRIRATATSRTFQIGDDKKKLLIFRKLEGKRVSSTAIMTGASSNALITDICEQCGYTETVTTYTFRRGVANKLEAKTSRKRTQEALGHKGDRTWHAYAAPTISVDAQAIAYDELEDNLYTDFAQSIAYTRDFGAPKPANSKVEVSSVPSKVVLKAVADAHPSSRAEMIMRKARREQYKIDREEYSEEAGRVNSALEIDATSEDQVDTETTDKPEKELPVSLRPQPSPDFKQIMKYNPL
ncbi:hypothetical protein BDV95DRAFT_203713 [Massariosphaeria phaeospora]|uniref:Uncharacterized protein n=1 Tax=Massariosphaeria phaeospora TaxID=100035 RepID=A0A7C8I6R5_9PLEO|nr:hypothetical protein BDV95DRAFT_203713 [Massariosphaeria phaeospora]